MLSAMRRFCLLGWCTALVVAVASPRPGPMWSVSALLLLGFTLALIALFAGFLGRRLGAPGHRVRWALLTGLILLPALVFGLHRLNPPSDKTRIESTIESVATSEDPAYCESKVTTAYLEQTTGVRAPFADDRCEADAGRSSAESVDVTAVAIDGDRATATVVNHGGSFDGSILKVELIEEDGEWKLDRLVGFQYFARAKFERAYRRLFLQSGSQAGAAQCGLARMRRLSDRTLEHSFLNGTAQRFFARIDVACDRKGAERNIVKAIAEPKLRFPTAGIDCVAKAIGAASDGELVRLQLDLVAYNELLWNCDGAAVFAYLRRGLASYDDLDAGAVACVLTALRHRPRAAAIRLTYDRPRYEQLIEACERQ